MLTTTTKNAHTIATELRSLANVNLVTDDAICEPDGTPYVTETLLAMLHSRNYIRHDLERPRKTKAVVLIPPETDEDTVELVIATTAKTYLAALMDANDIMMTILDETGEIADTTVIFAHEDAHDAPPLKTTELGQRIAARGVALL